MLSAHTREKSSAAPAMLRCLLRHAGEALRATWEEQTRTRCKTMRAARAARRR
jgi:hypothetical protein